MTTPTTEFHTHPQFPYHEFPRTWLLIAGTSAFSLRLARTLLTHGDNVVLGTPPKVYDETSENLDQAFRDPESETLRQFLISLEDFSPPSSPPATQLKTEGSPDDPATNTAPPQTPPLKRVRCVRLDPRSASQCQAAAVQTIAFFKRLDILVANSGEVVIGTVEELGASATTQALLREQVEVNFYGNVNAIKAVVPVMRKGGGGHIIVPTGITSHLGTPGLGAFCAAGWALEGFCDSIAYEIAPFNIKVSIIQPHLETAVLPYKIKAAPLLPHYAPPNHPAPLARNVIGGLLDRIQGVEPTTQPEAPPHQQPQSQSRSLPPRSSPAPSSSSSASDDQAAAKNRTTSPSTSAAAGTPGPRPTPACMSSQRDVAVLEPPQLPEGMLDALLKETLFSVCAIGGHPNPPQRHIVGTEGVVSVKEKLKTVAVELEELVHTSTAVDYSLGDAGAAGTE